MSRLPETKLAETLYTYNDINQYANTEDDNYHTKKLDQTFARYSYITYMFTEYIAPYINKNHNFHKEEHCIQTLDTKSNLYPVWLHWYM